MEVTSPAEPPAGAPAQQNAIAAPEVATWRHSVTREERHQIATQILQVLRDKSPSAIPTDADLQKLKTLVYHIEGRFFAISQSKEEYTNSETLYERIKLLINRRHTRNSNDAQQQQQQHVAGANNNDNATGVDAAAAAGTAPMDIKQEPSSAGVEVKQEDAPVGVKQEDVGYDATGTVGAAPSNAVTMDSIVKQEDAGPSAQAAALVTAYQAAQGNTLPTAAGGAMVLPTAADIQRRHHQQQQLLQQQAANQVFILQAAQPAAVTLTIPQQQHQAAYAAVGINPAILTVQHNAAVGGVGIRADANTLAVAGAPAGASDAESMPRNMMVDYTTASAALAVTQPFMSNGAPVLMRSSGAAAAGSGGAGGMMHLGGLGGVPGAAGMPPTVKLEGGAIGMLPMTAAHALPASAAAAGTAAAGGGTAPAIPPVTSATTGGVAMVPLMGSTWLNGTAGTAVTTGGGTVGGVQSNAALATVPVPVPVAATQPPQFAQLGMVPQDGDGGGIIGGATLDELFGSAAAAAGGPGEVIHVGAGSGFIDGAGGPVDARKSQILKQQRWLLFLRHCAKCQLPENECSYGHNCTVAKQLWRHLINCQDSACAYPRCVPSRELLKHHQKCVSHQCPVCAPVKEYVSRQKEQLAARRLDANGLTPEERDLYIKQLKARRAALAASGNAGVAASQQQAAAGVVGLPVAAAGTSRQSSMQQQQQAATAAQAAAQAQQQAAYLAPIVETQAAKRPRKLVQEQMGTSLLEYFTPEQIQRHMKILQDSTKVPQRRPAGVPPAAYPGFSADFFLDEESTCKVCRLNKLTFEPPMLYCYHCNSRIKRQQVFYATPKTSEVRAWVCHGCFNAAPQDNVALEGFAFRKDQLEKRKNDQEQEEAWVQCDNCEGWVHQICGLFNKGRNNEDRGYLCPPCLLDALYREQRKVPSERPQAMLSARDLPKCDLSDFLQSRLEQALAEERAQRAAQLGVSPSEISSAYGTLTIRVVNNVTKKCEVKSRFANAFGVGGSAAENYPDAFLYKQKVVLLFQELDGVDMCLYCLYVQEYGSDAPAPNTRTVYLSYLDSVKYFQPEDAEAAGLQCKLRTMVYHEVLLGYLAYAKAHGFTSMYIWACPPLAGDDYIYYCHPNRQKNPRSDRLREWYLSMLRRSKAEGTVVYISNLYDTFFEGGRDHRFQHPSATALPYLEGDYWVGEAENLLSSLQDSAAAGGGGSGSLNGGSSAHVMNGGGGGSLALVDSKGRKAGKDKRLRSLPNASLGEQLLARLGDNIRNMKEDFIVAHLYESCSFCREYIDGGMRHYHPSPPSKITIKSERAFDGIALDRPGGETSRTMSLLRFQLCQKCYDREAGCGTCTSNAPGQAPLGLPNGITLSDLIAEQCPPLPPTADTIPTIDNEFFDTRHQFLSLCQGNHYQFDTVRRARHSSMMVLYHLHNPSEPAFAATCNICKQELPPGEGFRCTVCTDFDVCPSCAVNPGHKHELVAVSQRKFDETRMRMTDKERKLRDLQLQRTMAILIHASECANPSCASYNCHKIKGLFQHVQTCNVKITGGCPFCRRVYALLSTHAKMCTNATCAVPKCRSLRMQWRDVAARQEDKRRAAYRKMLEKQHSDPPATAMLMGPRQGC